jgi:glyoxylase-like metal-dependent hydrolase (beta-lactamase superfamily II)
MHATSPTQFRAASAGRLPEIEEFRPGMWSVPVVIPGEHLPYNLCYLITDSAGQIHLIDPGADSDQNENRIREALGRCGSAVTEIASITVTHLHPDHLGLALRLRSLSGAALILSDREDHQLHSMVTAPNVWQRPLPLQRWGVPVTLRTELAGGGGSWRTGPEPAGADLTVASDDRLPIPGRDLRVLLTPGHTIGHLCVIDRSEKLLFTGDHVLPTVYSGLGLGGDSPTNPIADYLVALDALDPFASFEVCPGHEYRFRGLADRRSELSAHHLRRSREVARALDLNADATIWEVAGTLTWSAGWAGLRGYYLLSALSQTALHVDFVRSPESVRYLGG